MDADAQEQFSDTNFTDLWGSGLPVPQEVAYVDAIIEEGETTYFILDNVENEVVITDTPAVRCEQITNGTDVMQYTGLRMSQL